MTGYSQEDREAAWGAMIKMKHDLDNPAPRDQLTAALGWCAPSSSQVTIGMYSMATGVFTPTGVLGP